MILRLIINFLVLMLTWLIICTIFTNRDLPWWAYVTLWLIALAAVNNLCPPYKKKGEEKAKNG